MSRNKSVAFSVAAALLSGVAWFAWVTVAETFAREVGAWAEARRAEGYEVAHGKPVMSGFPVLWRTALAGPSLARTNGESTYRWRGPELFVIWRLWAPERMRFAAPGTHALEFGPTLATVAALSAEAEIWRTPDGQRLEARIAGAEAKLDPFGLAGTAGEAAIDLTLGEDRSRAVVFARRLALTVGPGSPLGREVDRFELDAEIVGPLGAGIPELGRWRDAGGRLEVRRLALDWGPLSLTAAGSLLLDAQGRPQGELVARVQGINDALGRFEAAGMLAKSHAAGLALAAALVTKPNGDGKQEAELPVIFSGGTLFLGPVAVARLPALYP